MRKIFRKAKITQILCKNDISSLVRDYETEDIILRNCRDNLSMHYHGIYENPEDIEDMLSLRISELTQKHENYTMGEDPFTGDPVLYRKIQKQRINMILTFSYKNSVKSATFSIDISAQQAVRIKEGMRVWTILTKTDDGFDIEKILFKIL